MTQPALLIAGHGTSDVAGAEEFRAFTDRVGKRLASRSVSVAGGFIELSPPPLGQAVAELVAAGHSRIVMIPLMLVAAGHAKGDIPGSLAHERQHHPGLSFAYGRPLGPHPKILSLLRERLGAVDASTWVVLVGRGSTDPDANSEVAKVARLLEETTDVAGVEYAFISLAPPGVPRALERCAALGAKKVVVLPYFLFGGVLPDRVVAQSVHSRLDIRVAPVLGDTDSLADLVIERYDEALAGDIRMNCDSCIYRVSMPGFEAKVGVAQTPHHHPFDGHTH